MIPAIFFRSESAAQTMGLFPEIWIERTRVPLCVGVEFNAGICHSKQPRLGIVWACRKDACPHKREGASTCVCLPVSPRLVSRALANAEDTLIFGSPNRATRNQNGYDSRALQERSAMHTKPNAA